MIRIKTIFLFLIFSIAAQAFAGQCDVLPAQMADKAYKIISKHRRTHLIAVVDYFCKACLDKSPKAIVVDSVTTVNFQHKDLKSLEINNTPMDLAYIYLDGENIGNMVGCNTRGVQKYL